MRKPQTPINPQSGDDTRKNPIMQARLRAGSRRKTGAILRTGPGGGWDAVINVRVNDTGNLIAKRAKLSA
jgi:hypothetical protein